MECPSLERHQKKALKQPPLTTRCRWVSPRTRLRDCIVALRWQRMHHLFRPYKLMSLKLMSHVIATSKTNSEKREKNGLRLCSLWTVLSQPALAARDEAFALDAGGVARLVDELPSYTSCETRPRRSRSHARFSTACSR